jgi:esterase/lipase superfamily enzyme
MPTATRHLNPARGLRPSLVFLPLVLSAAILAGCGQDQSPDKKTESPPPLASGGAEPQAEAPPKKAEKPEPRSADGDKSAEVKSGEPQELQSAAPKEEEHAGTRGLGDDEAPVEAGQPPAAAEGEAWDVVPVLYGTDRARLENPKRLDYGDERGRRLELGRALVTVPKSHTVPQIERPWTMRIPLVGVEIGESEDPKEHFTMKELTFLTEAEFLAEAGARLAASSRYKKHALVFVHGFNTTFDFAIYRTAQIAYDLKFDGVPFAYSWPSGGGILNYTYDRESSGQAEPFLKDFMKIVLERSGAEAVSLVAHSMGNQPVLQVLKDLKAAKPDGVVLNQIILAAPDVDRDNFENIAKEIKGLAKGITLYAAANDKALAISRNVNGGVPRAGDVPETGPLVIEGVDTVDVTRVSTDSLGLNHSGYAENNDLLQDVRVLIETGVRPPEKRIATTKVVEGAKGMYWEFEPAPR